MIEIGNVNGAANGSDVAETEVPAKPVVDDEEKKTGEEEEEDEVLNFNNNVLKS
jgi:hypothetical protein